jgi:hypothetical protein
VTSFSDLLLAAPENQALHGFYLNGLLDGGRIVAVPPSGPQRRARANAAAASYLLDCWLMGLLLFDALHRQVTSLCDASSRRRLNGMLAHENHRAVCRISDSRQGI